MLRCDLCDYSDAYIVVKGNITVEGAKNRDRKNRSLAFKNHIPFIPCISKINDVLIENAEDLDIVMPMYNLIEYSKNYRKTTGSLWNYYRDEPNDPSSDNYDAVPTTNSASFKYKNSLVEKTPNNDNNNNNVIQDVKVVVPLKHLSNFWRTLNMPLINCEVALTLNWPKNCVLTDVITRSAGGVNLPAIAAPTGASFALKYCKLYVPIVTLSAENDSKALEQLNTGFKRTITWNKYRSEMFNQARNNNLNYLFDPTFTKVNRLFVLSLKNEHENDDENESVPKVEVKDFNVLINGKPFFDIPVRNREETYEPIVDMSRNNDYTTGDLLDYEYFSTQYKSEQEN